MTVKQYFLEYIFEIVKDRNHSERILDLAQRSENLTLGVPWIWDNDIEEYAGYHIMYIDMVTVGIDHITFNYLNENCPGHEIIPEMERHFNDMI